MCERVGERSVRGCVRGVVRGGGCVRKSVSGCVRGGGRPIYVRYMKNRVKIVLYSR